MSASIPKDDSIIPPQKIHIFLALPCALSGD